MKTENSNNTQGSANVLLPAVSRKERVEIVNNIIKEIASRGRKFFYHEGKVAELVDFNGKIYYRAEYGKKELICLTIPEYRSPSGWFHGGTLLKLTKDFREFIKTGKPYEYSPIYSPHWGYPESDMKEIRQYARALGFLA